MEHQTKFKPTAEDIAAIERAMESIRRGREIEFEQAAGIVIDPAELRRTIKGRRLRDQFFGTGLFEEPAWDMLLELFAAQLEHQRVSVSALGIAAAVAPTTALRWISKLTDMGFFERHSDEHDRRRSYVELSERVSLAMCRYIAVMRREGLNLG